MKFSGLKYLVLAVSVALIAACGNSTRKSAIPDAQLQSASISGMEDIRYVPSTKAGVKSYLQEIKTAVAKRPQDPSRQTNLLALSGGGDNGAFGAGLLVGWTQRGDRPMFDQVTGISTGALIAPFAFLGPDYDQSLQMLFTQVSPDDIYRERGKLGVLFNDALADASPLKKLIDKTVDTVMLQRIADEYQKRGRLLLIGTTNIDSGSLVLWNMGRIAAIGTPDSAALFRNVMLASAAVPGAFPPVLFDAEVDGREYHELHVDGGLAAQVYLYPSAVSKAAIQSGVIKSRKREAYIIRNARLSIGWEETERNGLGVLNRSYKKIVQSQGLGNLYQIYEIARRDKVGFNLAYIGNDFEAAHPAEFDKAYMNALFQYGYEKSLKGYPWQHMPPGLENSSEEDLKQLSN